MRAAMIFVTMLGLGFLAFLTVFALVFDPTGVLWIVSVLPMIGFLGNTVSRWSDDLTPVSTAIKPLHRRANNGI